MAALINRWLSKVIFLRNDDVEITNSMFYINQISCKVTLLSSPRAKRAGPMGLRAESARAVTGRRCPHSGKGEDFLSRQPDFFTETAVTSERKVEKSFPRWEINRHDKG